MKILFLMKYGQATASGSLFWRIIVSSPPTRGGQMDPHIKVEVQGGDIKVALRGTCLRAAFRKGDAPWLVWHEHGPDDRDATVTLARFRALAWEAANLKAREMGWID